MKLPSNYRERIPVALELAELVTAPAGPKATAVALANLSEWLDIYGVVPLPEKQSDREKRVQAIATRVSKDLEDLPSDLLVKAVRAVTTSHRYSKLPLPGEFRAHVDEELARRRGILQRLQTAARFAQFEAPQTDREIPTDEQRGSVREILRSAGIGLRAADADELDDATRERERAASVGALDDEIPEIAD